MVSRTSSVRPTQVIPVRTPRDLCSRIAEARDKSGYPAAFLLSLFTFLAGLGLVVLAHEWWLKRWPKQHEATAIETWSVVWLLGSVLLALRPDPSWWIVVPALRLAELL